MSKSSKNSKENSCKEIVKVVKDAEGMKLKNDKLKKDDGSKSQTGSSTWAYLVGRASVSKMKKLKKSKDPYDDSDSEANEDYMTFLIIGGFHPDVVWEL